MFYREVIILMEATEDGEVELQLSYIVQKSKWIPRYDIRVFSGDSRMKVNYSSISQCFFSIYGLFPFHVYTTSSSSRNFSRGEQKPAIVEIRILFPM